MQNIKKNVPLSQYTSWLVGGIADHFCMPLNEQELNEALLFAKSNQLSITILSGGTNVLVSDAGIRGLVVCLKKFSGLSVSEDGQTLRLECLAGTAKSELLKNFLKYKLPPALFLAGIPGDVGGGVVMNAGVAESFSPREFCELVEWIEVLDFSQEKFLKKRFSVNELNWSYRHSSGWQPGVITKVGIKWPLVQDQDILQKVREANRIRLSKQPLDLPSCGSVFVNPPGLKSAQLIDQCGLKGFRVGGAEVSSKHANFIVNVDQAKARDILDVIHHVQKVVKHQKGVELQTEVIRLGVFES